MFCYEIKYWKDIKAQGHGEHKDHRVWDYHMLKGMCIYKERSESPVRRKLANC